MVSTRSSSNETSTIHETNQRDNQSLLNLPRKPQNQYFKYGNFYNMGQHLIAPNSQMPDGRATQLYNNQDISNVHTNMLRPVIVNNYILPYGIDPYAFPHNHPHNMPPHNSRSYPYSNQFQRPSGPNSYGRNYFSKK